MTTQELKYCPFCNSIPRFHGESVNYGHGDRPTEWSVRCDCGLRTKGFPTGWEGTEAQCKDKAAAIWSRRAT